MKALDLLSHLFLALLFTLPLSACMTSVSDDDDTSVSDDDDTSASDDDDSSSGDDDDTAGDDDDSQAAAPAPPGQTLCAAGGRVSGEGISGVVCLSPVDMAAGITATSADGSLIWQPGPITRIAP